MKPARLTVDKSESRDPAMQMRLICLLPCHRNPAKKADVRHDLGISHHLLARLVRVVRTDMGIIIDTDAQHVWINPASWAKAQEVGQWWAANEEES